MHYTKQFIIWLYFYMDVLSTTLKYFMLDYLKKENICALQI